MRRANRATLCDRVTKTRLLCVMKTHIYFDGLKIVLDKFEVVGVKAVGGVLKVEEVQTAKIEFSIQMPTSC